MSNKSKGIILNDKFYPYKGKLELDLNKLIEDCVYYDEENKVLIIYQGLYNELHTNPGIYYDEENKEFIEIPMKEKLTLNDLINENEITTEYIIINDNASIKNNNVRSDEILNYIINNNDDELVKIIKNNVNKSNITIDTIVKYFANKPNPYNSAYNFCYALRKRSSIYIKNFIIWMKILQLKVTITIDDIVEDDDNE